MFVEIDTGNISLPVIRRKALRIFQYFASGKYIEDLGTNRFPRTLFVAPSKARLSTLAREIRNARKTYKGSDVELVRGFPFWLATYDEVEITTIDQCMLSRAPL